MKKALASSLQRLRSVREMDSVMHRLLWPSTGPSISFEDAVDDAILKKLPLFISSHTVINLTEGILLKTNGTTLHIVGLSDGVPDARPLIISSAHSIFQVGGRGAALIIENLRLRHTCHRDEHKDIGAVIFGLSKAKVQAYDCDILSDHGFGIWAVQRASIGLKDCTISSSSRSGCVSFGKSSLSMESCTVYDCSIHGVCSRGSTFLSLTACSIISSGIRGIYAYHNVSLIMTDTLVSGTNSSDHAALDLWSCSLKSSCRDQGSNDPGIAQIDIVDHASQAQIQFETNRIPITANIDNDRESIACGMQKKDLKLLHPFNKLPENSLISFELAGSATDSLNVKLLRCVISGNMGVGLRIRQGQPGSGNSRIRGSVLNCSLHDNTQGNFIEIVDEVDDKQSDVHDTHDSDSLSADFISSADSSSSVVAGTDIAAIDEKHRVKMSVMVWEFERDDPAAIPNGTPQGTASSWRGYDSSVSAFIESKHRSYQKRCGVIDETIAASSRDVEITSDLCSTISLSCDSILQTTKEDSVDSDNDSQFAAKSESSTILLPDPYSRYVIDFRTMQQTNLETHYMRAVRFKEVCN